MALSSARQESRIDPDNGIYVEMEGILEVRWTIDDEDSYREPEDFMSFQERIPDIPDSFCHKNMQTTEQAYFYCLVCNCELMSPRPLRDHVKGNKHIKKACEKKRQVFGAPSQPQNAPRIKEIKKDRPVVDITESLETKLRKTGEPAIGLEYITEFVNPRNMKDPRMYTCRLDGCKSAWGTSADIYNHVIRPKHHKNFFIKMSPGDSRVAGMNNSDILKKAAEWEEQNVGDGERVYSVILREESYEKYMELRNRPSDWSEKKASLGLVGSHMNPNMVPLGSRKRNNLGRGVTVTREHHQPLFDPVAWQDWKPSTQKETDTKFLSHAKNGVAGVADMVDSFQGTMGDEQYKEITFYSEVFGKLIDLMKEDFMDGEQYGNNQLDAVKAELDSVGGTLVEKVEGEDRTMKDISKKMSELEDEIKRYYSDRTTNKYKNIQLRLSTLTRENSSFKPSRDSNKEIMKKYSARLATLWQDFEARSESLADSLELQMDKPVPVNKEMEKEIAVRNYRKELVTYVEELLIRDFRERFTSVKSIGKWAESEVDKKYLPAEEKSYVKRGGSWAMFKLTDKTKKAVEDNIAKKIQRISGVIC